MTYGYQTAHNKMATPSTSISCLLGCVETAIHSSRIYSCIKVVGSGGNLGLNREYSKKLFEPMFYSWCNCPLSKQYATTGSARVMTRHAYPLSRPLVVTGPAQIQWLLSIPFFLPCACFKSSRKIWRYVILCIYRSSI